MHVEAGGRRGRPRRSDGIAGRALKSRPHVPSTAGRPRVRMASNRMVPLEDWPNVKRVLEGALARTDAELPAYLEEACGADGPLRAQVEHLLAARDRASTFLEKPAAMLLDPPAVTEDLSGRAIGAYRVVSRLGGGGMGDVYLGHDSRLDRPVAIKFLSPELAVDRSRLRRFHQEAKAASSVNHPHIVVVHDFGELDGRPYMVTEFIEGETLRQRLRPWSAADTRRRGPRRPDGQCARRGTRAGCRAPGRQTRECDGAARRVPQSPGLRARQARHPRGTPPGRPANCGPTSQRWFVASRSDATSGRRGGIAGPGRRGPAHATGNGDGHAVLHVARADTRPRTGCAQRRLESRRRAVRDGDRSPAVHRQPHCDGLRSRSPRRRQ